MIQNILTKVVIPGAITVLAILLVVAMFVLKPRAERTPPEPRVAEVDVLEVPLGPETVVLHASGVVTGVAEGTADITATYEDVASSPLSVKVYVPVGIASGAAVPAALLLSASPNPFNPQTTLTLALPEEGMVSLVVYNVLGQPVATLVRQVLPAGVHRIRWHGTDASGRAVPSGVYWVQAVTVSGSAVTAMTLAR